jgi:hypothetical protein
MRVSPVDFANLGTWESAKRVLSSSWRELSDIMNARLTFSDNVQCALVTVVFTGANTTVAVSHTLGRVSSDYIVRGRSAAVTVFDSLTENTETTTYVQASGAATVRLIVF